MLESEADRLEMVRAVGAGAKLTKDGVEYDVIFDNAYVLAGDVEERAPAANLRSSDVARAGGFPKGTLVEVFNPFDGTTTSYRVRRLEPDGTGMSLVVLQVA